MAIDKRFLDFAIYLNTANTASNSRKIARELERAREELETLRKGKDQSISVLEGRSATHSSPNTELDLKTRLEIEHSVKEQMGNFELIYQRRQELKKHEVKLRNAFYADAYKEATKEYKSIGNDWEIHKLAEKKATKVTEDTQSLFREARSKQLNASAGDQMLRSAYDTAMLKLDKLHKPKSSED
jgi:hypothetical protein